MQNKQQFGKAVNISFTLITILNLVLATLSYMLWGSETQGIIINVSANLISNGKFPTRSYDTPAFTIFWCLTPSSIRIFLWVPLPLLRVLRSLWICSSRSWSLSSLLVRSSKSRCYQHSKSAATQFRELFSERFLLAPLWAFLSL
jgi:hypothetical protein